MTYWRNLLGGFADGLYWCCGVFPLKWPLQLSGEFVYVSES